MLGDEPSENVLLVGRNGLVLVDVPECVDEWLQLSVCVRTA